jgi:sRNA-binding protein
MGWSLPYTLGVLGRWKMAAVYCQAVLAHDQRIALDGAPAETVDAEAKDLAAKQLAKLAARKAKKAAEAAALAVVKPKLPLRRRRQPKRRSNCATGCVLGCCAGPRSLRLAFAFALSLPEIVVTSGKWSPPGK